MSAGTREETARKLVRLLARRLRRGEGPADGPMTVAELRRELLPYPRCREEAGLASKAEYDLAVLDLLASPRVLEPEDPALAEAGEEEREAAEAGLGFLEGFAAARLRPGPDLAGAGGPGDGSAVEVGPSRPSGEPGEPEGPPEPDISPGPEASPGPDTSPETDPTETSRACPSCSGDLPARDGLRFCPWCQADLTTPRCGDCGEELDPDWRFCPACGTQIPSRG